MDNVGILALEHFSSYACVLHACGAYEQPRRIRARTYRGGMTQVHVLRVACLYLCIFLDWRIGNLVCVFSHFACMRCVRRGFGLIPTGNPGLDGALIFYYFFVVTSTSFSF